MAQLLNNITEKDAVRPCVLHCFPCSILQCFPLAVFSHHQRATIGHNMPKYAKIGHKGLNKQKTKKTKKNEKTKKKNQRFLETVGIGGMSLFFFFCFFFCFLFFLVFFGFPAFPQINFFLRTSLCLFPHFGMKEPFVNNKIRFLRGTSLN